MYHKTVAAARCLRTTETPVVARAVAQVGRVTRFCVRMVPALESHREACRRGRYVFFFQLRLDLGESISQCPFTSRFITHVGKKKRKKKKPRARMAWKICRHLRTKWEIHWRLCELPLFILYIMRRRLSTIIVDLFVLTHSCGC